MPTAIQNYNHLGVATSPSPVSQDARHRAEGGMRLMSPHKPPKRYATARTAPPFNPISRWVRAAAHVRCP